VSAAEAAPVSAAEAETLFADLVPLPALVLAVSGGPDSTALLLLAARWRAALRRGPDLLAVTIDHRLRPDAAAEAQAVKRVARQLGVAHRTLRWTGAKPATGLPQAAREARYRLLAAAADKLGGGAIVTAHTRDDQAETVLMRLARGSGLTGLCGMARRTQVGGCALIRPLLDLPKVRLIATLAQAGIPFADDPSNRDPRFTRARMRGLLPALAQEGLVPARLVLLAGRLRRAEEAIEAAVDAAAAALSARAWGKPGPVELDAAGLALLAPELRLRLLGRAIGQAGDEGPVELGKLELLAAALDPVLAAGTKARFRRTLAGAMVTLAAGRLVVERAPARRHAKA
jgi:tRNA(Ile)-lysidine synthase